MLKLNLGAGGHPLDGFDNLDATSGWRFEDGLPAYADGSVDAITISHALMYVPLERWPYVFSEFARVLKPGGVIRITEDDTVNPESERLGGYSDAVTPTWPALVLGALLEAGLVAAPVEPGETNYRDGSLGQEWHGAPPKVFHVEGVA